MARGQEIVIFPAPTFTGMNPHQEKSIFRKILDTTSFGLLPKAEAAANHQIGKRRVQVALETFREYSEGGVTGAILGALDSTGNIEVFGAPVDGVGALIGGIGRVWAGADSGFGKTMGDVGSACNVVFWFRMGQSWGKSKRKSSAHGEYDPDDSSSMGEDPVIETAKEL